MLKIKTYIAQKIHVQMRMMRMMMMTMRRRRMMKEEEDDDGGGGGGGGGGVFPNDWQMDAKNQYIYSDKLPYTEDSNGVLEHVWSAG